MEIHTTIDERNQIVLFNPAAERMFGVIQSDAIGQPISRFIPQRYQAGHDEHIQRFRSTGVTGRRMGALGAISGLRVDGEEFPIEASISQVDVAGERLATVILRDFTERNANEEARQLLAREVDHRARNALAVVQALGGLTTAPTMEDFVTVVRGRVGALSRAHSLLAQNRWQGGDLRKIVDDETTPYHKAGHIRFRGPTAELTSNAVQPVSLLIHELSTNAVKHGALSSSAGRIDIAWTFLEDQEFQLTWHESGGPPISQRRSDGFGTTLMATVLRQIGGEIEFHWSADGVRVIARLPSTQCHPQATPVAKSAEQEPSHQWPHRVLIVEDELLVGMEIARAMQAEGGEVMGPAGTLAGAFALLNNECAPDVAILDINLNGKLAYPIADLLRTRAIPFIFCTGYETTARDERYSRAPIVHKPTNLHTLIEQVGLMAKGATPTTDCCRAA